MRDRIPSIQVSCISHSFVDPSRFDPLLSPFPIVVRSLLSDEWRKNKRYVEYKVTRYLSDYNHETIPGQSSFSTNFLPLSLSLTPD